MCLITKQTVPEILEQDLIVYKVLSTDLSSVYSKKYQYEYGELNKTNIELSTHDVMNFDYISLNSWLPEKQTEFNGFNLDTSAKIIAFINARGCVAYGPGFHSAESYERLRGEKTKYNAIFKCTIPAGSEIYRDASGLIISNQIIINTRVN